MALLYLKQASEDKSCNMVYNSVTEIIMYWLKLSWLKSPKGSQWKR
jgi:hypothetical protein